MKTVKLKMIVLALLVTTSFIACDKDDDKPSEVTKKSLVTTVTGATTGTINNEITLNVTFGVENNCGAFNKFIETTVDKTKTIEVEAKYVGSNCGTTATTKTTTYKFKATSTGTYIFKFKKSPTEFVTHTIVIS